MSKKTSLIKRVALGTLVGAMFASSQPVFAQSAQIVSPIYSSGASTADKSSSSGEINEKTLDRIRRTGVINVGYRKNSIPLSYYSREQGKPIGYSLDVCNRFIENLKEKIAMPGLRVAFTEVTGETRVPFVRLGRIDMECGATTNTPNRRKEVEFSIPHYISSTQFFSTKDNEVKSIQRLKDKTIAVAKGTAAISQINKLNELNALRANIVEVEDVNVGIKNVAAGKADYFVLDDLILFAEKAKLDNADKFIISGDIFAPEAIAIMYRKNEEDFGRLLDAFMVDLVLSGEVNAIYKKWFEEPIPPNNKALGAKQSELLKDLFRMPTTEVGS